MCDLVQQKTRWKKEGRGGRESLSVGNEVHIAKMASPAANKRLALVIGAVGGKPSKTYGPGRRGRGRSEEGEGKWKGQGVN